MREGLFTSEQVRALLEPYILRENRDKEWHDKELGIANEGKRIANGRLETLEQFLESKHPKVFKTWEEAKQPKEITDKRQAWPSDWDIKKRLGL